MYANDDLPSETVTPTMLLARNSDIASIPYDIHIGFYKDVSKSEVINLIKGYADKNFSSKNNIYYQIKKYSEGYLFEIHQGGSGRGYLHDLLDKIDGDNLIVVTSQYVYKVYQSHHAGIKLLKLTNKQLNELHKNPDDYLLLNPVEKISKVKGLEQYLLVFSFIICMLSFVSASVISGLYVYSVHFKGVPQQLEFTSESKVNILDGIKEVKKQRKRLGSMGYIKKTEYMKESDKWLVIKGFVQKPVKASQSMGDDIIQKETDEKLKRLTNALNKVNKEN